ncbi:transporter substrate-binding domain-containing protein [Geomonas subterranea]|uniref:transporter substrate-binding domain-containing protein n=1 Tax=Geomonas subterranea TaxID=2847989 RepID=UPI001CD66D38|nr:transporter substrate-binding domain-containing protein [Geomonas fuzhouensis]
MNWKAVLVTVAAAVTMASGVAFAGKPVLNVGTEGVYAPFTFKDKDGKLTGYDIEVLREAGKRAGFEVNYVPTPWDSMFLGLESKKFDAIANQISKNPQREKKFLFSDNSYLISGAQLIVRGDKHNVNSLEDLRGLKVGTGAGSNYSKILEEANKNKQFEIKYYDGNFTTVLQDIVTGRLDATLNDRLTVGYNIKQLKLNVKPVGKPVDLVPSYFVFRQDAEGQRLKKLVDEGLKTLKKDGTLAKLSVKWFGADYTR